MTTTTPAPKPALRSRAEQREDSLATVMAGDFIPACQSRVAVREAEAE